MRNDEATPKHDETDTGLIPVDEGRETPKSIDWVLMRLDKMIFVLRRNLVLPGEDRPGRSHLLRKLAEVLIARFKHAHQLADLDEAISLFREALGIAKAVQLEDQGSSFRNGLAGALEIRIKQMSELNDIDDMIILYRETLALCETDDPRRSYSLSTLAVALLTRFKRNRVVADLDEVISLHRQALALRKVPHADRPRSLSGLATALQFRFERIGELVDLDEAIVFHREGIDLWDSHCIGLATNAQDHTARLEAVNNLAAALSARFGRTDQPGDLDEAIVLHGKALSEMDGSHSDRARSMGNLASALRARFQQKGQSADLADLDKSISLNREALRLRGVSRPSRSLSLNNLAGALHTRYKHAGQLTDLDEAISLHREALELMAAPHRFRWWSLNNLGGALQTRFEKTGQVVDLDQAISYLEDTLVLEDAPQAERPKSYSNLATALCTRFRHKAQLADLDRAIFLHREGLALWNAPHSDQANSLHSLAVALQTRFQQTREIVDLHEAVFLHRRALALRDVPHPDRPNSLGNLASALALRSEQQKGAPNDLYEAITHFRAALALRSADHPDQSTLLNNLAMALHTRFKQIGQVVDLDEAIFLHREALQLRDAPHPDRSSSLNNLAEALQARFGKTGQPSDLKEAIDLFEKARQALPKDHPLNCPILTCLGECFELRSRQTLQLRGATGDSEDTFRNSTAIAQWTVDINSAIEACCEAAHCESALVSDRLTAAWQWVKLSDVWDGDIDSALNAYQMAIGLLPRLAVLGLDLNARQRALTSNTDGLARDAVACAIRAQQFDKAIELLEAGRAVFWSQALQLRTPLNDLEAVKPELARKLKDISRVLEQGAARDMSRSVTDPQERVMSREKEASLYRQKSDEWSETVDVIRKEKGFDDFLRPKSFATLSVAAARGPIVILNASGFRSQFDALVMRPAGEPIHVALSGFTREMLDGLSKKTQRLSGASFPQARGDRDGHRRQNSASESDRIFRDVLLTLWKFVVWPIIQALGLERSDTPPRLWWLPTGPFSLFPLHAAGIYDAPGSVCVSDYVVSSYTPTLSTLLAPPPIATKTFKTLAVIQPITEGEKSLPYTRDELCRIQDHIPSESLVKLGIPGTPTNVNDVLFELLTASIVHFACHGIQNLGNPLDSALLLEDGHLKVSQLMGPHTGGSNEESGRGLMDHASLVFLSACKTAMVDGKLPDESIHLAATLLFTGFRGAVATMWAMEDSDGPKIADHFYRQLFSGTLTMGGGTGPGGPDTTLAARALHVAVARLRDELCNSETSPRFVRWVPFVHMGL